MSATPIPYLLQSYKKVATAWGDPQWTTYPRHSRCAVAHRGCAAWRRPGIHTHGRGYGFRARSFHSRPGM